MHKTNKAVLIAAILAFGPIAPSHAARPSDGAMMFFESHAGVRSSVKANTNEASSDHQASPKRAWQLKNAGTGAAIEAFVLKADGVTTKGVLKGEGRNWTLQVDARPMDGSLDGIFTLYAVQRQISDETLNVQVAKANMINHSCGWKHPYRFDAERLQAKSLASIPLEIVGDNLWDDNFHVSTMSGDELNVKVLSYGQPAAGASVTFETGTGWRKAVTTDAGGGASIQLIGDYFPKEWRRFNRRTTGSILITASYAISREGAFSGKPYRRIRMVSTLPWKYYPPRQEYASYAWGLGIATLFVVVAGISVFTYRERRNKPYREVKINGED